MQEPSVLSPAKPLNALWYLLGLAALAANKVRHAVRPYGEPRPFAVGDFATAAEYDLRVFDNWMTYLHDYLGRPYDLAGKTILELGPGPDLGVAALALAAGANRYIAFDRFPLAQKMPREFHERLLATLLAQAGIAPAKADALRQQVPDALMGYHGQLTYIDREDFDLSAASIPPADLIVSQAAFEHFDDPEATIGQLSRLAAPGAVFLAVVDLQTHTRLLREADPLNIYRFSPRLYRLLSFPGLPNRARPHDYIRWLTQSGWTNIKVRPLLVLDKDYLQTVFPRLAFPFRHPAAQMECLTITLCATRPTARP